MDEQKSATDEVEKLKRKLETENRFALANVALYNGSKTCSDNSDICNTFISTCLQKCRNFRDFFVDYVRAWNQSRRDFGNLVSLVYTP